MAHLNEITCLLLLEGDLDAARATEASAHIGGCALCSAMLRSLQQESLALGHALREADESLPARLHSPAGFLSRLRRGHGHHQESVPWAWLLSFGLAAASFYVVAGDYFNPLTDQLDQTGIQSSSLLTQLAVSGVFWEGWESMLSVLEYAAWAAIGLGVIVMLGRHWRRSAVTAAVIGAIGVVLAAPAGANAAEVRRGQAVTVPAGETVQNDLVAMGRMIRVDGDVNGDLMAFGQSISVDGHVTGDVIAAGDSVRIAGMVDGNVRCFCNTLTIDDGVAKNVSAFAAHVDVNPKAVVGGGMIAAAGNVAQEGKVNRDLLLFAGDTSVNGATGGDIWLRGGRMSVGPMAEVGGRLQVASDQRPEIAAGAKLAHALEYQFVPHGRNRWARFSVLRAIVAYGAAFLCGLLLMKLFPAFFESAKAMTRRAGMAMSIGALVLLSGIVLVLFSLILFLAGAAAGIAAIFLYVPIVYVSQVFVGAWVGERLGPQLPGKKSATSELAWGLLIVRLLGLIPFLGFFVWAAVAIWGTGAVVMALWNRNHIQTAPVPA